MGELVLSGISTALVLDRQLLCRSGLAEIIRCNFPACEVETCDDIEQAIAWLDAVSDRALLVLDGGVDLDSPGVGGIRGIRMRYPHLSLVIVDWRRDRRSALRAIESGAHGYIPKDLDQDDMLQAFELVMAGQVYVPPVVGEVETDGLASAIHTASLHSLTGRQREVLTQMSMGKSNKEIARALEISESTVKVHVAASFRQLGVHNRVGAVAMLQGRNASAGFAPGRGLAPADFGNRASDRDPPKRAFG